MTKKTIYKGHIVRLNLEEHTLPNGKQAQFEIIRHSGAAAAVPLLDEKTVILIHQYRPAAGGWVWEIPAGRIEADEKPAACIERELIEEIGYRALELEPLCPLKPALGYSDETIHLFIARQLQPAEQALEEHEILTVKPMPMRQALTMIESGEISDSKTQVALLLAARRLGL